MAKSEKPSRYSAMIEHVFANHYSAGVTEFEFDRSELIEAANALGIPVPKNLGDIVYSFRYRVDLPESVTKYLPEGWSWLIWPVGQGRYKFIATDHQGVILPNGMLPVIKIPDSTPGVISLYALSDEQALLAKLSYCRLLDVFTGLACYRLQSHLRTSVVGMGQVETDDVYIGVDKRGAIYVLPVQAKGKADKLSVVQAAQDLSMCSAKFPDLIARAISAQFMPDDSIAMFSFDQPDPESLPQLIAERHYRLVPHAEVESKDLQMYSERPVEDTI